jgi:hypothetical protein
LHVGIVQAGEVTVPRPVADTVLDVLKALPLELGTASGDCCTAEEMINIPAELWTEAPDSDDDEC